MAKRNVNRQKSAQQKKDVMFCELSQEWLSVISLKVKASTYALYNAALNKHILPSLGKSKANSLTLGDFSKFVKEKLTSGRLDKKGGLSAKTVCDMLSIIKSILDHAFDTGKITSRPKLPYPKHHHHEKRVFNRKEQKQLESNLTQDINIYKLGVLLSLYTGIRVGELCALRWQDISFEQNIITVKSTLQRVKNLNSAGSKTKITLSPPKSPSSVRQIPIPEFLSSIIKKYATGRHEFFLATEKADFTEPRTMQNHFARILKQLKISKANFHATRHTFATRCVEAGVDIKSLSEMLGHSNVNITLNRYVHSSLEQKRECIGKLERHLRSR